MREKLEAALAQLETKKRSAAEARKKLKARAAEQLDSMPEAIHTVEAHMTADKAGGILGARRLRTMHHERERLSRIADVDE